MSSLYCESLPHTCLIIFVNVSGISGLCFILLLLPFFWHPSLPISTRLHLFIVIWNFSSSFCLAFSFSSIARLHVYTHILLFPLSSSLPFPYLIFPLLHSQTDLSFLLLLSLPLLSFFLLAQTSNTLLQRKRRKRFSSNYNIRQIQSLHIQVIIFHQSWNDDLLFLYCNTMRIILSLLMNVI